MKTLFKARIAPLLAVIVVAAAIGITVTACEMLDDLIGGGNAPEAHRGTWEKGSITLKIEKTKIDVSGASSDKTNGNFKIRDLSPIAKDSPVYEYKYGDFGIKVELLQNGRLRIYEGSGPGELYGLWTKKGSAYTGEDNNGNDDYNDGYDDGYDDYGDPPYF